MITIGLTKDYAAIASDSSRTNGEDTTFGSPKITLVNTRYIFSYLGSLLYFSNLDTTRFTDNFNQTVLYLQTYLTEMRPKVKKVMKESNTKDEPFLMAMIGILNGMPTAVVLSEEVDFEPRYTWTKEKPKFLFLKKDDTKIPETFVPGLMGEFLTRDIYKKSDVSKKKVAGGVVTVGFMDKNGPFSLSNWEVILNGNRKSTVSEHSS